MKLLSLYRYPVKSLRGAPLAAADVHALGLRGDRRFMIVDADGRFVSARERPELLRWQVDWTSETSVTLVDPDGDRHEARLGATHVPVTIWKDLVPARVTEDATSAWLEARLGAGVRLVHIEDPSPRIADPEYASEGDRVSFADGFPVLLLSAESHAELEARAGTKLAIERFRPNLVVTAGAPHAEDAWRAIRIGTCTFDVVKPCVRCVLTTRDPWTGDAHPEREPLKTLLTYRRGPKGVTFGMNVIPRSIGTISAGDPIEVLA